VSGRFDRLGAKVNPAKIEDANKGYAKKRQQNGQLDGGGRLTPSLPLMHNFHPHPFHLVPSLSFPSSCLGTHLQEAPLRLSES
jgi:hypothetical protein